jgi:hypothetical protein
VLIDKLTKWIEGYMYLDDSSQALVAALWAVNTWVFDRFDACPYLCLTSNTMAAGKTRLMELLQMVSRNGHMVASVRPAAMLRMIQHYDSKITFYIDDAQSLSGSSARVLRSLMEMGYRRGQTIPWPMAGGRVQNFPVYCPKCFALIGELNDTLRDRSIEIKLQRGEPVRDFVHSTARSEAAVLVEQVRLVFEDRWPAISQRTFLTGRDGEIWASLFRVAEVLRLDNATVDTLTRTAADLVAKKTAPRELIDRSEHEQRATDKAYGQMAVRDLVAVLHESEPGISSAVAVERMKAITTSPWRTFRGTGINETLLSDLVSRFGVAITLVRMDGGRKGRVARGYAAADIRKAREVLIAESAAARARIETVESSSPAPLPTTVEVTDGPSWLEPFPAGGVRALFQHLALHGTVTENEAFTMLGGARGLRSFSNQFETFIQKAPFGVSIHVVDGVRRFVREGRDG